MNEVSSHVSTVYAFTLDAIALFLGLCLILFLTSETAFQMGRSRSERHRAEQKSVLEDVQSTTLLTLVALLLAFGVSMAEIRFEARKQNLTDEGNAFNTTSLRAALLSEAARKAFREQLARNLEARIEFYDLAWSRQLQRANQRKTDEAQGALWKLATDSVRESPSTTSLLLLIHSLNQLFDLQENQSRSYANHLPGSIVALLLLASVFMVAAVSYICGLKNQRSILYTNLLTFLVAATIFVIMDLDRPRGGLIQIHPNNLVRLLESLRRT